MKWFRMCSVFVDPWRTPINLKYPVLASCEYSDDCRSRSCLFVHVRQMNSCMPHLIIFYCCIPLYAMEQQSTVYRKPLQWTNIKHQCSLTLCGESDRTAKTLLVTQIKRNVHNIARSFHTSLENALCLWVDFRCSGNNNYVPQSGIITPPKDS